MKTGMKYISILGSLFFSGHLWAADCNTAMETYMNGDARGAMTQFKKLAGKGDGCAQFQLGMMHFFGHGTDKDEKQARQWVQKSVKSGFKKAEQALANWEAMKKKPDLTSGWG